MSQSEGQDIESGNVTVDGELRRTPTTPTSPSQGESILCDSSGPLFTMYSKIAEEEDNKMAERWQKDAEGIIIFTGLFSAVVAAFVVVSVQDLRPSSQDISAFYLENIYQLLADPNLPRLTNPSTMAKPPPFSPPAYAVWVNTLWFLSLVISLTCAMLATSLQQWTRRHIRITQPARRRPHKRARVRAYFANGIDKFHVPSAAEAFPALVHLSLFTFFAGLLVYLFNINHTVFGAVICWVAILSGAYACITLMPIFWHDSPYYAPLSSTAWTLYAAISYTLFKALAFISDRHHHASYRRFCEWRDFYYGRMFVSLERVAEEAALKRSSEMDVRVLDWTLHALVEDDALENFLESIPGFYKSGIVKVRDFPLHPHEDFLRKLRCTLRYFLSRDLRQIHPRDPF